jgi:Tfp pilus assembly protein PilV
MGPRSNRQHRGFSLLECLLVAAFLAVGFTAIVKSVRQATRVGTLSCDMLAGSFLAQDILEEIRVDFKAAGQPRPAEQMSGQKGKFRWQGTLQTLPEKDLSLLTVTILWDSDGKGRDFKFFTYLR